MTIFEFLFITLLFLFYQILVYSVSNLRLKEELQKMQANQSESRFTKRNLDIELDVEKEIMVNKKIIRLLYNFFKFVFVLVILVIAKT